MPRPALPSWDPARLQEIRSQRRLTLERLAQLANVEYSQLKRYIYGLATPPPAALVQIARALEVPTTDLAPLSERPDLTEYRWHAGLQVNELARRVDLASAYVGEIARGAGSITQPDRWADALGITVDQVRAAWQESRRRLRDGNQRHPDNNRDADDSENTENTENTENGGQ